MLFTPFAFIKSSAGGAYNPDAQIYFNAVENGGDTLTVTEKDAVNTLVNSLQADSIWGKLQAIYPLVGGTSNSMKWNLKDPQDFAAAFKIDWIGTGWTFNSNGAAQSNSNTTYGNTNYSANTNNNTDGMSMGVYINGGTNATGYDLGMLSAATEYVVIAGYGNNTFYSSFGTGFVTTTAFTMPNGFFAANSDGSTTKGYRNGVEVATNAQTRDITKSEKIFLGNRNGGGLSEGTDRRYAFGFLGKKLDATSHLNLYNAVQTFNTTLSRNI